MLLSVNVPFQLKRLPFSVRVPEFHLCILLQITQAGHRRHWKSMPHNQPRGPPGPEKQRPPVTSQSQAISAVGQAQFLSLVYTKAATARSSRVTSLGQARHGAMRPSTGPVNNQPGSMQARLGAGSSSVPAAEPRSLARVCCPQPRFLNVQTLQPSP